MTRPIIRTIDQEHWTCPHCHDLIRINIAEPPFGATEVAHRCPANRNRWTYYHRTEAQ